MRYIKPIGPAGEYFTNDEVVAFAVCGNSYGTTIVFEEPDQAGNSVYGQVGPYLRAGQRVLCAIDAYNTKRGRYHCSVTAVLDAA